MSEKPTTAPAVASPRTPSTTAPYATPTGRAMTPSPRASTRRSYTSTLHDNDAVPPMPESVLRQITHQESRITEFGGNDPAPPEPKTPKTAAPLPGQTPPDPNMVTWDGPDDPENPQNWSLTKKWIITMTAIICSIDVTSAGSGPSVTTLAIQHQFGVPKEASYLITTVFLAGYACGPILWGPGSELIGRQPITLLCMLCYTLFIMGQALATNFQTLLVTRFISGLFAITPQSNTAGLIADLWDPEMRGFVTNIWSAACFVGPACGPVVSAFIVSSSYGWRWVFWVMMMFSGACTILAFLTIPETYAPILLARKAKRMRKENPTLHANLYSAHERQDWSYKAVLSRTVYRPFIMLAKEPILVLVTAYTALLYAILFAMFQAFPIIYVKKRHMPLDHGTLLFIGVGIGTTIGSVISQFTFRKYPELTKKWRGFPPPEERLWGAMWAGPFFVISIFWMGWTGQYPSVPWYVPGLSTILFGITMVMCFVSLLAYLVDTYLMYAASAFAANTMIRCALASAFPLFSTQMFDNMGVEWACTFWALISLLLVPSPFIFYKYGARIRERSVFAPCIDLKIKKVLEDEGALEPKKKVNAV